jgi:oxygen-independent coproporphyrinogen-3 oxidase
MRTLGLYIQVPFCSSKCSFCNFSSRVERQTAFGRYCCALQTEIEELSEFYAANGIETGILQLPVDTLYVGGGTPSLLGIGQLTELVRAAREFFHVAEELEFTIEVTPGSSDGEFLRSARALGINRLSIGAQSFDEQELRAVGRLHSPQDTSDLVRQARRAGFNNVSLDLIAGLPYQTEASWRQSLKVAAQLRPQHLSLYLFEIDEKSRLGREITHGGSRYHAHAVPSEEFMARAYEVGREFLSQEGFAQYELSNFALPGRQSRHNLKYWQLASYIGIGAGAHSFDGLRRWANETNPTRYQEKIDSSSSSITEIQTLSPEEQLQEFFFLGLRQTGGVDISVAAARWGQELSERWNERLQMLVEDGWLEIMGGRVRLLERAFLVSSEIFQEFVTV